MRDMPVERRPRGARCAREPDRSRLREIFREFELRDPLRRLEEALGEGEAAAPRDRAAGDDRREGARRGRRRLAALAEGDRAALAAARPAPTEDQLPAWPRSGPLRFAGLRGRRGRARRARPTGSRELSARLGDRPLTAHDWKALAASEQPAIAPPLAHDTLVAAYLLDPARRGYPLDELAEELGSARRSTDGEEPWPSRRCLTRALAARQRARSRSSGSTRLLSDVELPLVDVLVEMERAGVQARRRAGARDRHAGGRARPPSSSGRSGSSRARSSLSARRSSSAQILFEKLGLSQQAARQDRLLDRRARAPGDPRRARDHPQDREVARADKAQVDLPRRLPRRWSAPTGRLRTTFSQVTAATGRLSCNNPNLQNIPIRTERGREIRACFVAEEGNRLISADYSQVELRLLAHIAGEEVLKEIFRRGEDVHTATAAQILGAGDQVDPGTRSKAKMVNYGIVYGLSAFGLADRLQIPQEEAQEFIDALPGALPGGASEFIDATIAKAHRRGLRRHAVRPHAGAIPELRARQRQTRTLGERLAVNTVIQGTAADIIKVAMVRATRALRDAGLETRLVLQIHDELLFEGPESEVEQASEIVRARDGRRVRDGSAARGRRRRRARTGSRRSSVDGGCRPRDRRRGRPGRAAGADQLRRSASRSGTFAAASISFAVGLAVLLHHALDRRLRRPTRRLICAGTT